jgi:hypothetical protein
MLTNSVEQKLTTTQLVKILLDFYGTSRFITMFLPVDVRVRKGFIWLRMGFSGGLLRT